MAQTPAAVVSDGRIIDHTPGSAVAAGDVVVINSIPTVAEAAIASGVEGGVTMDGVFRMPKKTGAISALGPVYWDTDGDPVTGTAGSGAATTTAAGNLFVGYAVAAAASDDEEVDVKRVLASPFPPFATSAVTAAGSAQGDAAALADGLNVVAGADDAKGVILPAATAGRVVLVKSTVADKILKIYPATGDAINALSANGALSLASGPTPVILVAYDTTTWYTFPLLPS